MHDRCGGGEALGFNSGGVWRTDWIKKPDEKNKKRTGEKAGDKKKLTKKKPKAPEGER
jgi:hypothetical protein